MSKKHRDEHSSKPAAQAAPVTPAPMVIPQLDDAQMKALAAEIVRQMQEAKTPGTGLVAAPATDAAKPEHAKLRPAFSFLSHILAIPQTKFMEKLSTGVIAGSIKTGVTAGIGLTLHLLRPDQIQQNIIDTAAAAAIVSDPVTDLLVRRTGMAAGWAAAKLQKIEDRKAGLLPDPKAKDAAFADAAEPAAIAAPKKDNLVVMPEPAHAAEVVVAASGEHKDNLAVMPSPAHATAPKAKLRNPAA